MLYFRKSNQINRVVSLLLVLTFFSFAILPEAQACWWKGYPSAQAEISGAPGGKIGADVNLPNTKEVADPVFVHNGDYVYAKQDLNIAGRGLNLEIVRTYKSQSRHNGRFGVGWEFNFNKRLVFLANGNIYYFDGEGGRHLYTYLDGTNYICPLYRFDTLIANPGGSFTLTEKDNIKYQFNQKGWLTQIIDRNGNSLQFEYASEDTLPIIGVGMYAVEKTPKVIAYVPQLTRIYDTLNRIINLAYDERGRLKTITDFAGRTWTYKYNEVNDLISVTTPKTPDYPQGLTTTYTYTVEHNLETITDPKGETYLTNKYDDQDRVEEQTYGSGTFYFSYDEQNSITTVTSPKGYETQWTYSASGNPLKKEVFTKGLRLTDPDSYVTTYTYDNHMQLTKTTYPKGNWTKYTYDNKGNLLEIRRKTIGAEDVDDPVNDIVTTFTYEPNYNFIKTITDPEGNVTTYTYDYELNPEHPDYAEKGNLIKITYPTVGSTTPVTQFTYNNYGQVETTTDPNGNVTKYVYYPDTGYLKQIVNDYGTEPENFNYTTEMTYDSLSNVTSIKNAQGYTTTFVYNALNQLTQTTSPAPFSYLTKYQYDENGNLRRVQRQADATATSWQTTDYTYTDLDKLETINDELGNVTTFSYDANGNRTSIEDAEGNTTTYVYDERDLLWKVTDALSNVTEYAYDGNGNLKEIKDARSNKTTYAYDDFDRLETTNCQDVTKEEYTYDKNSNLYTKTNQKNQTITYAYDALNRLSAKTYPDASEIQYQYDAGSRLAKVIDSTGTIYYDYDAVNRVIQVTYPDTNTVSYEYDALGNRTKLTYPDANYITYEYDQLNRLNSIKDQASNIIASYTYDVLSRRTELDYANSTQTTYEYDDINRLTNIVTQPSSFEYTYDKVGNRLTSSLRGAEGDEAISIYTYDTIYQLTNVTYPDTSSTTYNYDAVGNRTSTVDGGTTSYVPDNMNQYDSVGGVTYTYDANGNLTDDGVQTYEYDYENRLTRVTPTPPYTSLRGSEATEAIYAYDAFGRRIKKDVDGAITNFIYDGDQVIAETNATGTTTAKYTYGPGIDEPIRTHVIASGSEAIYYYHFDGLGSVTALTDSSGTLTESYEYDIYGDITSSLSTVGNPYYFTGRRYDPETNLYYYRARYYSPSEGRFLQTDPIGYLSGINLYTYVVNNPVNFVDPFGWDKDKPWWEKAWDWWSDLVAPGAGGVISAKPGETWEEYYERFRRERIYEFAASEAIGIVGGWTSIGTTAAHSSFTEGLRLTGSQLGNKFVSVGGKGFWYMRGVLGAKGAMGWKTGAIGWRQVASGAQKGSAVTWIITSAATGYRIGLQLDAWLSYKWTKRQ